MMLLYTEGGNHPHTGESVGSGDSSGDGDTHTNSPPTNTNDENAAAATTTTELEGAQSSGGSFKDACTSLKG